MIGGIPLNDVLLASAALFTIGVAGALLRRNAISIFLSIEVMMNAANLALVAFARMHGGEAGQVFALIVMVVAACEVTVGLGLIVAIHRRNLPIDVDELHQLRVDRRPDRTAGGLAAAHQRIEVGSGRGIGLDHRVDRHPDLEVELLAGAGFSIDMDRGLTSRDARDHFAQLLHHVRATDQPRELWVRNGLVGSSPVPQADRASNELAEDAEIEGL